MKRLVVVAVAAAFLIIVLYFVTADHWWWKAPSAKVTYQGKYSPNAHVYRSRKGNFLISLESNGHSLYEVHYSLKEGSGL